MAEHLEDLSKKLAVKLSLIPFKENIVLDPDKPTFDERFVIIEKVRKLSDENFSAFIKELTAIYPKVLSSKDKKIQIMVDALNKEDLAAVIDKLDSLIKSENISSDE